MNIVPLTSQSLMRIEFSLVSHCGHIWGSSLIIPKSTHHPTNKKPRECEAFMQYINKL